MVVLTGLAMFSFMVMGSFTGDTSNATLPILCGVVGMAIFGFFGWRRGEPVTFGGLGIVLGIIVGVYLTLHGGSGPKPPIETDAGNLRTTTSTTSFPVATQPTNSSSWRLKRPTSRRPRRTTRCLPKCCNSKSAGRFSALDASRRTSRRRVLGFLLDKEADEMGIVVSEHSVSDYINRVTNKKLTSTDFNSVIKSMRLSDSEVFDAIRGELKARLAMEMLIPRSVPSPEEYWKEYRKLQVTETLDVAAVPVADFLSAAPNPTEDQLLTYFDAWKEIPAAFPGGTGAAAAASGPRRISAGGLCRNGERGRQEAGHGPGNQKIRRRPSRRVPEPPGRDFDADIPHGADVASPRATKAPAGRPAPVQKSAAPGKNGASLPAKQRT